MPLQHLKTVIVIFVTCYMTPLWSATDDVLGPRAELTQAKYELGLLMGFKDGTEAVLMESRWNGSGDIDYWVRDYTLREAAAGALADAIRSRTSVFKAESTRLLLSTVIENLNFDRGKKRNGDLSAWSGPYRNDLKKRHNEARRILDAMTESAQSNFNRLERQAPAAIDLLLNDPAILKSQFALQLQTLRLELSQIQTELEAAIGVRDSEVQSAETAKAKVQALKKEHADLTTSVTWLRDQQTELTRKIQERRHDIQKLPKEAVQALDRVLDAYTTDTDTVGIQLGFVLSPDHELFLKAHLHQVLAEALATLRSMAGLRGREFKPNLTLQASLLDYEAVSPLTAAYWKGLRFTTNIALELKIQTRTRQRSIQLGRHPVSVSRSGQIQLGTGGLTLAVSDNDHVNEALISLQVEELQGPTVDQAIAEFRQFLQDHCEGLFKSE